MKRTALFLTILVFGWAAGSASAELASAEDRNLTVEQLKQYDFAWKFISGKGHYSFNEADPHPFRGIATGGKTLRIGYTANGFRMAILEEVLEAFPDTPINIDIGSYGPDPSVPSAATDALVAIMNRHPERSEGVIVASFGQAASSAPIAGESPGKPLLTQLRRSRSISRATSDTDGCLAER